MQYKTNYKIEQIIESTVIVGTDIAKNQHVARALDFRGIELGRPLTFKNSQSGFIKLYNWLEKLISKHDKKGVIFGVEPTGHYWLSLAQFLRENGIKIVLVNPMHVKKSKELDDNSPTKNDAKDARVIAQLVKDGRYSEPHIPTGIYAELRAGMNLRDRLTEDLRRVQGRIYNWLDRFFPEFLTVFKKWEGKAAMLILKSFPLPQEIVDKGVDGIMECWKQGMKRSAGKKKAIELVDAALTSIGLTEGVIMGRQELNMLLAQYESIQHEIEQLMQQIENMLEKVPGAQEMMTITGVGLATVAGFIAEVGDLNNYSHPRQIQKLAGLNLKENSSGEYKGQTSITKRGRPRLRALLFKCIMPLVAKNQEFKALHNYYTTRTENPLKKMQSMIALCCKLIRVMFAIGRKKTPYDGEELVKNSSVLSLQEAA
ncbi:MAG: IS110 family transposase [Clostridiales bacterium]|nr:IS110 family transposase [Clostridiales bacterium]MCF8021091.1 IS110 family transposase [Clostridiales bacterium]